MDVVPRGTELEIQLRRGVGQALYTCNNIHIDLQEFIGHKQRNTDTKELYGVPYSGSWIPSQTIIVQLLTTLLVTDRDTVLADCSWNTKRLLSHSVPHIARAINT